MRERLTEAQKIRKFFGESDAKRDEGLKTPEGIIRCDDIRYGEDEKWNLLDVYYPKEEKKIFPTIINIHGGGWVYGDKEVYQFYCMDLARRGFTVVNFNYRLAPEHVFPAIHEDINAVFSWVAEHGKEYHLDTDNLFVTGDSAGAQLASQYMALLTNEGYRSLFPLRIPADRIRVRAVALNCGVYDIKSLIQSGKAGSLLGYLANLTEEEMLQQMDAYSYITEKYPPVYVMTSEHDFLKECTVPFYQFLKEKGVACEYKIYGSEDREDLAHVFHLNIKLPEAGEVNDEECAFFRKYMR